jgi:hypothetical protein
VLDTVIDHGPVTAGVPFVLGETVTGGTSGTTGVVTHLGPGGAGEVYLKMDTIAGPGFVLGELLTGTTSGAIATSTSAPRGYSGGSAVKKVRLRYFVGANLSGIGVPVSGFATLVAGSGVNCVVTKGTGPGGSDEATAIIADGAVGGDPKISVEWDFLTDGVPNFKTDQVQFEIDRS